MSLYNHTFNRSGLYRELERVMGIEPTSQPWEGHILPMYYTRKPFLLILELNQNDGLNKPF